MSQTTRKEVLTKLRRRYSSAGPEHKRRLLDDAQALLGYHPEAGDSSVTCPDNERCPRVITGRPVAYEPELLLPHLRPIWRATDYACGRRLVAMLPEWVPAYGQHERRIPAEVRDKLLEAFRHLPSSRLLTHFAFSSPLADFEPRPAVRGAFDRIRLGLENVAPCGWPAVKPSN